MHRIICERLREDPSLVEGAHRRIDWLLSKGILHPNYAERWRELLAKPLPELLELLPQDTEEMQALRQCSPFSAWVVTEAEREKIIREIHD